MPLNLSAGDDHLPSIRPGIGPGEWVTFCPTCSRDLGDVVARCRIADPDEWPATQLLVESPTAVRDAA